MPSDAPKFSRLPGVDIHTNRGMDHMRAWNKTTARQLDTVAAGNMPTSNYDLQKGKKAHATDDHTRVNLMTLKAQRTGRGTTNDPAAAPGGVFDMTPPYGLGAKLPADAPHKAHHHYFGWGNTMDNTCEPDGSRAGFNTYGHAQGYCDKIHNKAAAINSKRP